MGWLGVVGVVFVCFVCCYWIGEVVLGVLVYYIFWVWCSGKVCCVVCCVVLLCSCCVDIVSIRWLCIMAFFCVGVSSSVCFACVGLFWLLLFLV